MTSNRFEDVYNEYVEQTQGKLSEQTKDSSQEHIVAVRKNDDGDLIAFKTNRGRELDYVTALEEAKNGSLAHVDVFHKYGRDILRSEPDGIKENNLDELPEF
ncbi:DUF3892 domain-containing protein [Bacillus sp. FJAT-47783]|uniref:DUF3892 domain-containing protein n=1 Tax=Bacillus sp. FJAT-47783 TaxID=2922712 RepID=UPI001FAE04A3|nr:DUF3892 domain-containing protein [Bacillus sp. FJAT-47783]